jgi:hypothetical protein
MRLNKYNFCGLIRYVLKVIYLSHSIQSLKNEISLQLKLKNLTLSNGTLAPEVYCSGDACQEDGREATTSR